MKHWRLILLWGGLLLALVVVNHGIVQRERILSDGRVLLLELQPVDPRSLMQGDYMALRFAVVDDIRDALDPLKSKCEPAVAGNSAAALKCMGENLHLDGPEPRIRKDGYTVFALDADGVGRFIRVQATPRPVARGEIAVRYRQRNWWEIRIASNAWFFPEGQAKRYAPARYGELRVNDDGEALLTGLRDDKRKPL
ncbi:MAG: GDYXXLXY domain-containing protein [Lysobacteraceae bacterium]